jgi:hypothetical protein
MTEHYVEDEAYSAGVDAIAAMTGVERMFVWCSRHNDDRTAAYARNSKMVVTTMRSTAKR